MTGFIRLFFIACFYRLFFIACFYRLFFIEAKNQKSSVWIKLFFYNWFNPALILPCVKNVGYSAAGTLADIDQIKHFHEYFVARIRNSPFFHLLFSCSGISWIFKYYSVSFFSDYNASNTIKVCIYQTVCEGFPQCFMYGSIINTVSIDCFKRYLDIFNKFIIYSEVKITYITGPFTGT